MSGPALSLRDRILGCCGRDLLTVVAPSDGAAVQMYSRLAAIVVYPYDRLSVPRRLDEAFRSMAALRRDIRRFRAVIRSVDPDFVTVATTALPAAVIASRLEHRPTILYCGELFDKGSAGGIWRAGARRLFPWLYPTLADGIVCCSDAVAAQFNPSARAVVRRIYPSVAMPNIRTADRSLCSRLGIADDRRIITCVGTLTPARGQDVLISAMPQLLSQAPDVALVVAGEPTDAALDVAFTSSLRRSVEELGVSDHVRFAGHVDDVAELLNLSSVVVNPARFAEPFGRVAFEALAAGTPVVSTDVGAVTELLSHRVNCLLVPPENPVELATAISRLLHEPILGQHLVRNAADALMQLAPGVGIEAYEGIVKRVAQQRNQL